jgi:hypothetical protein
VLQRATGGDTVFRTDLAGDAAVPVFTDAQIEDFRATAGYLVVSTMDAEGHSHLIVTDPDGQNPRELPLPGEGTVTNLQSADRGNLIGYTFTDADVGSAGARASVLFTASLTESQSSEEPTQVTRTGGESRVDDWRFVPGTDSLCGRVLNIEYQGSFVKVELATELDEEFAVHQSDRDFLAHPLSRGDTATAQWSATEARPLKTPDKSVPEHA